MILFQGPTRRRAAGAVCAMLLASAAYISCVRPAAKTEMAAATSSGQTPEETIRNWPKEVQATAKLLIEGYGAPSRSDADELVWSNNGSWRKTVLHREGLTQSATGKGKDHLEQFIAYEVPAGKVAELGRFDKRIVVNQAAGEISSRADAETMNFLTLNLANDIVQGQRTVREARAFSAKVKMLEKTGKSSPYLEGFVFAVKMTEPARQRK